VAYWQTRLRTRQDWRGDFVRRKHWIVEVETGKKGARQRGEVGVQGNDKGNTENGTKKEELSATTLRSI
jgi:hypothetical protein